MTSSERAVAIIDHTGDLLTGVIIPELDSTRAEWITLCLVGNGMTLEANGVRALIEFLERFEASRS